jgi:hypothetical protein
MYGGQTMKAKHEITAILIGLVAAALFGCVNKPPQDKLDVVKAVFDTLSAPEMRGRRIGTKENVATGEYLSQVFSEIGLEPIFGDSFACPYEQEVFAAEKAEPRLIAHLADGSQRELKLGSEFVFPLRNAPVDLTVYVTFDLDDPALADKIYVDKTMASLAATTAAMFNIRPMKPGYVSAQPTETSELRSILVEESVLQELLDAGLSAFSVSCRDTKTLSVQNNYIGVIRGEDSTRAVMVGAHFDGAGGDGEVYSSGAIDNASGVATMVGMAQLLNQGEKPPIDVVICALNGEEGSRRYGAEAVAGDLYSLYEGCYYINVDCVGLVDNNSYQYRASGNHELESAFAAALEAAGYALSEDGIDGDWTAFKEAGMPAVSLAQETLGVRHTTADRPEMVNTEALKSLASFLADFIRNSGENVYVKESSSIRSIEKKAIAHRQRLVDSLGLGFYDSYMYQFGGYYVCISGNRPVRTAQELKAVYPWIAVRETLGPYQLQEVLAVDDQTNRPFEISDGKIVRKQGPDGGLEVMPFEQVVHMEPGALDNYYFVYKNSEGRCISLHVSRLIFEGHWESLATYCEPLVGQDGREVSNVYANFLRRDDREEVALINYYPGGDFVVRIMEYNTTLPVDDSNGYGNYECAMKPITQQEAVRLVEQLGLHELEGYFSSLLRPPSDN